MANLQRMIVSCVLLLGVAALACGGDDGGGEPDSGGGGGGDPVASFTATPDCTSSSSTEIRFVSTSTDPDGQDVTCEWTFASCTNGACSSTSCEQGGITFPHANPYNVTLVVTDSDGNTDSVSQTIDRC